MSHSLRQSADHMTHAVCARGHTPGDRALRLNESEGGRDACYARGLTRMLDTSVDADRDEARPSL